MGVHLYVVFLRPPGRWYRVLGTILWRTHREVNGFDMASGQRVSKQGRGADGQLQLHRLSGAQAPAAQHHLFRVQIKTPYYYESPATAGFFFSASEERRAKYSLYAVRAKTKHRLIPRGLPRGTFIHFTFSVRWRFFLRQRVQILTRPPFGKVAHWRLG